jgi:hypothetical protein
MSKLDSLPEFSNLIAASRKQLKIFVSTSNSLRGCKGLDGKRWYMERDLNPEPPKHEPLVVTARCGCLLPPTPNRGRHSANRTCDSLRRYCDTPYRPDLASNDFRPFGHIRNICLARDLQRTLTWSKLSPGYRHMTLNNNNNNNNWGWYTLLYAYSSVQYLRYCNWGMHLPMNQFKIQISNIITLLLILLI